MGCCRHNKNKGDRVTYIDIMMIKIRDIIGHKYERSICCNALHKTSAREEELSEHHKLILIQK